MAIETIPKIDGPSYGGVIYGLSLSSSFSGEPTKLILDIVNKDGVYTLPEIGATANIKFGSFNFKGSVFSYTVQTTSQEKILKVTLIDNSIILDRYYVLLWKRGLLGELGVANNRSKLFRFPGESALVPLKGNQFFPFTLFDEKQLGPVTITRTGRKISSSGWKRVGNAILVGEEKFRNSECDIPDTWYSFEDLRKGMPGITTKNSGFDSNGEIKNTYEGTLREVLRSWCADFGYDFIWNYANDELFFYNVKEGITDLDDPIENEKIISSEISTSMEGTFCQYNIAYASMPKQPSKSLPSSKSFAITYTVPPIGLGFFARRNNNLQELDSGRGLYGSDRGQEAFIVCGLLNMISPSLRDLYCIQNGWWDVLGYSEPIPFDNRKDALNFLKNEGYDLSDYELVGGKDLINFDIGAVIFDESLAESWRGVESEMLDFIGQYYRIPDSSNSFFYCNENYVIEIDITVDPEGQSHEMNNLNFGGRKLYRRDGRASHDSATALEELFYTSIKQNIEKITSIHLPLKNGAALNNLKNSGLVGDINDEISHIILVPSNTLITTQTGFSADYTEGRNKNEATVNDIVNANKSNKRINCKKFEEKLAEGSCLSAEEEARDKSIKKLSNIENNQDLDRLIGGLIGTSAPGASIKLLSGSTKVFTASTSLLQVVCKYNININKISSVSGVQEFLWSSGNVGGADKVANIRVSIENITDPYEDNYSTLRERSFPKPDNVIMNSPSKIYKYVFAGEPDGVSLNIEDGLTALDVSLSSDGYKTSVTFSTRPPIPANIDSVKSRIDSQFNRSTFNSN